MEHRKNRILTFACRQSERLRYLDEDGEWVECTLAEELRMIALPALAWTVVVVGFMLLLGGA